MKSILFISPYPFDTAPSQRFRFEQYFSFLKEQEISYHQVSFLDQKTWDILYKKGHFFQKVWGIVKGFARRKGLLFSIPKYDFIFIHREVAPIGPPIFEWIIAKVLRKKIIYDFDDAIWLPNTSETNKIVAGLKWHQKVNSICKWSYKVSCGNEYLANYAKKFNSNVVLLPTTIDTLNGHNKTKVYCKGKKIIIGWTGTHSTIPYLNTILPILSELEQQYDFEFRIISNKKPSFNLKSLHYVEWNKSTEINDLLHFDLGLMPLQDDQWAQGKCGFKALQYMALGIPAVVSPVGVNTTIVEHQKNGFICTTLEDWKITLSSVLENQVNLSDLGKKAQEKVEKYYSVNAQKQRFLNLFS